MHRHLLLSTIALTLLLTGCKDGGDGPFGMGREVTLSGTLSYERVPTIASPGVALDYSAIAAMPMRGVTVAIVLDDDSIYRQTSASSTGTYSLRAPADASFTLRAIAQLGDPEEPDVQVGNGSAVYNVGTTVTTTTTDQVVSFTATTGWDGTGYSGARNAAPFAVLDTIYDCMTTVRAAAPGTVFPFLRAVWSPSESGSYFDPTVVELHIAGIQDTDTDEFDDHVVAHEWGHFYVDVLSRDDSFGGPHSLGDILDETVAYSEGLATALSGMFTGGDPSYRDTSGAAQATGFEIDLEADSISDVATTPTGALTPPSTILTDGWYSELSVAEVIWDLYDATDGDEGGNPVALGFAPIHTALRNSSIIDDPHFISIYQLLARLKADVPSEAVDIDALASLENISASTGGYQAEAFVLGNRYIPLTLGVNRATDNAGRTLGNWTAFGTVNKLFNFQLFRISLPAGSYRLTVKPVSGNTIIRTTDGFFDPAPTDVTDDVLSFEANGIVVFAVGTASGAHTFDVIIEVLPAG